MIPDKIYIRHYWMPGELDDEWRLKPVEDEQCEEYIRKDALMEWAEGKKKHYMDRQEYDCGWNDLLDDLIDKLNSL